MAISEGSQRASRSHGGEGGGDTDAGAERLSVAPLRLVRVAAVSGAPPRASGPDPRSEPPCAEGTTVRRPFGAIVRGVEGGDSIA